MLYLIKKIKVWTSGRSYDKCFISSYESQMIIYNDYHIYWLSSIHYTFLPFVILSS